MRALLLEDDPVLSRHMTGRLNRTGVSVDGAASLDSARRLLSGPEYDCVILDRMVPGGDSIELIKELRAKDNAVPAMLITGRHTGVGDKVEGFESGADDYLVKPFSLDELAARVLALCRRRQRYCLPTLKLGPLRLDRSTRKVTVDGLPVELTAKEFSILELLMGRPGEVLRRTEVAECCWGWRDLPCSNTVSVHMASLRQKLGIPGLIRTYRGVGYSLQTSF